jgi:endonuclease G, mitochondrial
MKKYFSLALLFIISVASSFSQQEGQKYTTRSLDVKNLEIPETGPNDHIVTHTGYSLLYDESHEQADWVAYELTKEETVKLYDRTDKFIPDPLVATGSADNDDYTGSGYDRGHLAPAADMGWSSAAMAESFYYSNMSPQLPGFNRGIWKKLEELVRSWAVEYGDIFIVTGPVLTSGLPSIGPDKVSVPKYYYKVILDYSDPDLKGIGFILPNASSSQPLQSFAVTIDSVEHVTGLDFYPALPDDQEQYIEKTLCISCWSWSSAKSGSGSSGAIKSTGAVQCSAMTQAGTRCKRMTTSPNGKCYQHGGD